MAQEKKKQLVVAVPESLHRAAKIRAAKTGKPMAQVMREALEKWVAQGDNDWHFWAYVVFTSVSIRAGQ